MKWVWRDLQGQAPQVKNKTQQLTAQVQEKTDPALGIQQDCKITSRIDLIKNMRKRFYFILL